MKRRESLGELAKLHISYSKFSRRIPVFPGLGHACAWPCAYPSLDSVNLLYQCSATLLLAAAVVVVASRENDAADADEQKEGHAAADEPPAILIRDLLAPV